MGRSESLGATGKNLRVRERHAENMRERMGSESSSLGNRDQICSKVFPDLPCIQCLLYHAEMVVCVYNVLHANGGYTDGYTGGYISGYTGGYTYILSTLVAYVIDSVTMQLFGH